LAAPESESGSTAGLAENRDAASPRGATAQPGWTFAIAGVVLGALAIFAIFWPTVQEAVTLWYTRSSYNYAFLVIPISIYLIYERRRGVMLLRARPAWIGLAGMAVMSLAWLVADVIDVSVGRDIAVVGMVQALLLTVLGWRVFWYLLFPFLFLWLLVPTGDFLLPVLQRIAMDLTVTGMQYTGIPVFGEGFTIETPTGTYTVAPGCAGLNFLLAGLAFSLLYANLQYQSWTKRVACVVVMLGVAIVSNAIRIVAIIALAHYTNRELNIVDDHIVYGWGFFAVILLALTWFGMRFQDPVIIYGEPGSGGSVSAAQSAVEDRPGFRIVIAAVLAVAAAASAPGYEMWRRSSDAALRNVSAHVEISAPASIGKWRRIESTRAWAPATPMADQSRVWTYQRGAQTVDLAIGYFWRQSKTRDLTAAENVVFDNIRWRFAGSRSVSATLGGAPPAGASMRVVESRIRAGADERLVWQTYWVDGKFMTNRIIAKLWQAKAVFIGGEARAAFVSASIPQGDGAAAALAAFFAAAGDLPEMLSNAKKVRP
jgi:exosortase A